MDVHEAADELAKDVFGEVFLKLSPPPNISQQIATSANLHNIDGVRIGVKGFVKADDILMTCSFQNIILLHDFLEGALIRHISLIYRF